jgi:hypothetical protein
LLIMGGGTLATKFNAGDFLTSTKSDFLRKVVFEDRSIQTVYTDTQALMFCAGVKDSHANTIYSKFISERVLNPLDFFMAHTFIMKSREQHGADFIDYCLELPSLPFGIKEVNAMFTYLGRISSTRNNIIRLACDKEQVFEVFLEVHERRVVIQNGGKRIGYIRRSGQVDFLDKIMRKRPVIRLFMDFASRPSRQIAYFGWITGKCSFCEQPLTDPASVRWGYGPVCAKNYFLPWY